MHESDTAGVLAPPPLLYLGFLTLGLVLHHLVAPWPTGLPPDLRRALAALSLGGALSLVRGALRGFRRAGTEARPWRPTTALVSEGPYRFTRNPMYLGLSLLYLSVTLLVDSLVCLLLLIPLLRVVTWGVIEREERYLERKFGAAYRDYQDQVRRWI